MLSFQNKYGTGFKSDSLLVFFGNTGGSKENLQIAFPELIFKKVKQTHSDIVLEAAAEIREADAHYTSEKNTALLIATADCMPIMIHCLQTQRVAAVHAGWRGVENKITEKTLHRLIDTGSSQRQFRIWVGPHILQTSFEVSEDAYQLLSKAHYGLKMEDYAQTADTKYLIDLNPIVVSQIKNILPAETGITFVDIDTKTNADYFSYRRDQKTKERNLSFIALL